MRSMVLTGLGSEQDFSKGGTSYFLVFNGGELRVPISEEAAEVVVKEMYSKQAESEEVETSAQVTPPATSSSFDDDEVDQI
jgi:hypothetical protein